MKKWLVWQQEKVHSQNFDFEMMSINIGEKFRENIFSGSRVTEEKPWRMVKNTPSPLACLIGLTLSYPWGVLCPFHVFPALS